jgi:hypothetical protein
LAGVSPLFREFVIGALAPVAPIAAPLAVVPTVLALAAGATPPGLALGGVAPLVLGVAVVSRPGSRHAVSLAGVPEAVGSALWSGTAS